jgi:hypothetical protein
MIGPAVPALADIAHKIGAPVDDVQRVMSYMARWARTSFLTARGRTSKIARHLME